MNGPTVAVRRIDAGREIGLFVEAGRVALAAAPRKAAELRHEISTLLSPRSPVMRENEVALFVASRDGQPIGRISAAVSQARLSKHQDASGQFGFLEAVDDPAVFQALTEAAGRFLAQAGMRRMTGPFSLTINHEAGLLVHGFDEPHFVRTNYVPAYYGRQLDALGFRKAKDLLAYSCRVADSDYPERVRALESRLARRRDAASITTHGMSASRWMRYSLRLNELYNDAWSSNWDAVVVSDDEARLIAKLSRPVVRPSWLRIARYAGEPIAVVGQIPDMNAALPRDGRLLPFGWAKLLGGVHLGRLRRSRIALIGIASRWRGTPVGSRAITRLMAEAIAQARRARIEEVEISWMLEDNAAVLNLVRSLPARHTRTFRVYERDLERG